MLPSLTFVVLAPLLVCSWLIDTANGSHILVVLWPWSSRLRVITQLTSRLMQNPHEITILTAVNYMDTIQTVLSKQLAQPQAHVRFITYEHTDAEAFMRPIFEKHPIYILYGLKSVSNILDMKTIHNSSLMSELSAHTFDVLLGDVLDSSRVALAAILKCQRIDIETGAAGASAAHTQYNLRVRTSYVPSYSSLLPMGPYSLLQKAHNILTQAAIDIGGIRVHIHSNVCTYV